MRADLHSPHVPPARLAAIALTLFAALALAAQPATAAPFAAQAPSFDFAPGASLSLLSGTLTYSVPAQDAAFGFQDGAATVAGADLVCWDAGLASCEEGNLTLRLTGSFGLQFPDPVAAHAQTTAGVAAFADITTIPHDPHLRVGPTVAMSGATLVTFAAIPETRGARTDPSAYAAVVGLDNASRIEVIGNGAIVHAASGSQAPVYFQGATTLAPFHAGGALMPFQPGARVDATPSGGRAGVSVARLDSLLRLVHGAAPTGIDFGPFASVSERLLDGAFVTLARAGNLTLIRLTSAHATPTDRGAAIAGDGPLVVQGGHVQGGSPLVGFAMVRLPWWSVALWVLALAAVATRIVRKSPKESERWRPYNWIGWASGAVVALVAAWLWDRETARIWGSSLLTGGLSGQAFLAIAAIEVLPALVLMAATVTPLRILLRNALQIAGQGRFMRLATPVAIALGYGLSLLALRSYLDLFLQAALKAMG